MNQGTGPTQQEVNSESLKVVMSSLNRANKEGVFNLDESYLIKIALSHLDKAINQAPTQQSAKATQQVTEV